MIPATSLADDIAFRKWWARFERLGASPSAVKTLMRMNSEMAYAAFCR